MNIFYKKLLNTAVLLGLTILHNCPGLKHKTCATGSNREISGKFLSFIILYSAITHSFFLT